MHVLEEHQRRTFPRELFDLGKECLERSLSALLWGQIEFGIATIVGKRQHLGKESGVLDRGRGSGEQPIKLVKLRLQAVIVCKPCRAFHLADDRIKRAVGVMRRAEIAQTRVRIGSGTF